MENWIEELASEMADMILKEKEEYDSYLPNIYDRLSRDVLKKANELLDKITETDDKEQRTCAEMEELKRLLGYPKWKVGKEWRNYPTEPFYDLSYVEMLLR